ncbi:MAG: efflux RND transporter permease subunit [Pseudomonadota bacterium]
MRSLVLGALSNRVAANLLAVFLIIAGLVALQILNVRIFPKIVLNSISITVPYPGATPNEVETSVIKPIEERLEGLEGVRRVTGLASQNVGSVVVDLTEGEDISEMLDDIKSEIDRITVFPQDTEEPQIVQAEAPELVLQIVLYGDADLERLKSLADRVRGDIASLEGVSRVEIGGVPEYLIDVAVEESTLQAYGLSLTGIASAIANQSLDLSGGEIESDRQRLLIRATGERRTGAEFEDIVVSAGSTGTPVLLGDVANINDGLAETPVRAIYDGQPAAYVNILRVGDEKVPGLATAVRDYFENDLQGVLPSNVDAVLWRDDSVTLTDRINLLARNAAVGLLLVGLLLMAFLDLRIAFWTAFGVGVSFIGAFLLMAVFGVTINQLSLFGFILAIGIVVDDAIVVGENIHSAWRKSPGDPYGAARTGVLRVINPVLFSVTTTIVVFVPLLFVPGTFGQFLGPIAAVVIIVLILSLIESFLVLPRHLSHLEDVPPKWYDPRRVADPIRDFVAARLRAFREGPLRSAITFCTLRPAMTVLVAFGLFFASLATITSGHVKFIFFPQIEGDYVTAELELAESASELQTIRFAEALTQAAYAASEEMPGEDVVEGTLWTLGAASAQDQPVATPQGGAAANKVFVVAKLLTASERRFNATDFEMAWREAAGEIPGAQKLTFSSDLVGQGQALQFQISARSEEDTRAAVADIRRRLSERDGVLDVRDDRFRTTDEIRVQVKDLARSYGITQAQLASEVRAAFFGAEAVRIQRDREEIEVRVRLPEDQRNSLETLRNLRLPVAGGYVPLDSLADISIGPAPATITRIDGRRIYVVSGDVDESVTTAGVETNWVLDDLLPDLKADYEGLEIGLGGEQEEQARAAPAIARNFSFAMMVVFSLLALSFRSYSQPIIVMLAIPFGFMGALLGHAALGMNLTLLSFFGIIGLSGVIINNALIAIDFINERLAEGEDGESAIMEGILDRFRAILLTTLTTFLGVTPIILETSVQAQFLVPTAVSLGFGILIGTTMLIFVLPALAALHLRVFGHPNQNAAPTPGTAVQQAG